MMRAASTATATTLLLRWLLAACLLAGSATASWILQGHEDVEVIELMHKWSLKKCRRMDTALLPSDSQGPLRPLLGPRWSGTASAATIAAPTTIRLRKPTGSRCSRYGMHCIHLHLDLEPARPSPATQAFIRL